MAFWIELKTAQNLAQISEVARQRGLFIPRNILYQNKNLCAMRTGFASYDNAETQHVLEILKKILT